MPLIHLRPANPQDARRIFDWRNDPWIVSLSSSGKPVTWEQHEQWFSRVLGGADHLLCIIVSDTGQEMGVARLDLEPEKERAIITVYLLRTFTGRGFGPVAIREICELGFARWEKLETIHAIIRPGNEQSKRGFARAGFQCPQISGESSKTEMVLHRKEWALKAGDTDWKPDNDRTIRFFSDQLERHQAGPQAVNWGSEAGQMLRFSVLESVGNLAGCSVLDVGCGRGDFLAYLQSRDVTVNYTGCDIVPAMIESARKRFPGVPFEVCDLLSASQKCDAQFDYVLASGIFYLRQREPETYMCEMISRMFRLCRRGLAFNTLSSRAEKMDKDEFYARPERVLEDCLKISRRVVVRHDYLPHDFTVYLYREGA
jgi:RimJ/RimL family protein N-acetyltransferase/SAM-dependent methyltransferase